MKFFLTGGTGFLGEYLLARLLDRGHDVWCLFRNEARMLDTIDFLSSFGLPRSSKSLCWVKGDILEVDAKWDKWQAMHAGLSSVDAFLHSAASTRLHMNAEGDPLKTNVEGARALLRLHRRCPRKVHIVSTAYVCGRTRGQTVMETKHPRGDFVNVYEESKWEAEQLWMGNATIFRPSIIVGDYATGRCSSFSGWYVLFEAVHLLDRLLQEHRDIDRKDLGLDVPSDADGVMNIVPVDYVAEAIVRIIEIPACHDRIYHLTHPNPPAHRFTRDFIERRFNIGGINFVGNGGSIGQPRSDIERMVRKQAQTVHSYFYNNPHFDRTNTDAADLGIAPFPITEDFLDRLLDYATRQNWGH